VIVRCDYCCQRTEKPAGQVNRARKIGAALYCDRRCASKAKRIPRTKAERIDAKRLYDMAYRAKNRAMLKAKKRAYFQRTYDPVKAARERKKRMHLHVEYCRQPRYKAWKRKYDLKYRASEYGPFAEAYVLAINLNREIKARMSNYEIRLQNETLNKRQARARSAAEAPGRDRHSRAQGEHA
jgi:hypothetical protein